MRLEARTICPGKGRGKALVFQRPLSLLGGIDRESGEVLDEGTGFRGTRVKDRVLVFPGGKGSTAGSYVLYSLKSRGNAPAALVCETAEAVIATGAIISEIPMVDKVQTDLFLTGDTVHVDADKGFVEVIGVDIKRVVTAFLMFDNKVLILKRSDKVGSFPGHWAGVSGYIEGDEGAIDRARLEIAEETGLREPKLTGGGEVVLARGREGNIVWAVHPFLFTVNRGDVVLDWEHTEYRWISPRELTRFITVPKLKEALESALAGVMKRE